MQDTCCNKRVCLVSESGMLCIIVVLFNMEVLSYIGFAEINSYSSVTWELKKNDSFSKNTVLLS